MKTIVAIILTAAVTWTAVYAVISKKQTALRGQIETLQSRQLVLEDEKGRIEKELKAAKDQPGRIVRTEVAVAAASKGARSPEQILEQLKSLRVSAGSNRTSSIRRVVHQLESLADCGESALPPISEFLVRFEDVDYGTEFTRTSPASGPEPRNDGKTAEPSMPGMVRHRAQLDFLFPPSLRIGLVDVLKSIGGEPAESILAEMLSTSGRAVEVAYVARVLQDMAPNKYKETALAAAKDLLSNPMSPDQPNRLDENAKSYLYTIMAMYNDPAFSTVAQALLINADGQLDRNALAYLTGTLKEHAVPALYQAYKDPRLTNLWEKASIAGQALSFAGTHTQAGDMLKEIVNNEAMPSWMRAMTIQTLAGGTFFGGNTPTDARQIEARLDLLKGLPEFKDERMAQARADAIRRLTDHLQNREGNPAQPVPAASAAAAGFAVPATVALPE